MKLAFVNSAWPASWGGGEKWTVDAAEWFRKHEHPAIVIGRLRSKLLAAAQERNLPIVEFAFGGDFNPFATGRAWQILREHGTELVIVNFNKEAWLFGRASHKLNIPVVARHGFPLLRDSLHHRHLVEKFVTRLVVNAQAIRDEYARSGFNVANVPVIHNGVRIVEQRRGELRRRFQIAATDSFILAAGRIESQKRFDRVLEIAEQVTAVYPQAKFLIAGEGPDRDALESQVRERRLSDHIRFAGFIPDLAEIIGDADVFLLTSDQEGTPNVFLEAMAAGVACVAFAVGSVPEIMTNELEPYVIPTGDIELMTRRVTDSLTHEAERRSVGELMRMRVRAEFDLDISMRRFEQLFEETLLRQA